MKLVFALTDTIKIRLPSVAEDIPLIQTPARPPPSLAFQASWFIPGPDSMAKFETIFFVDVLTPNIIPV